MTDLYDTVKTELKNYLEKNSEYKPKVKSLPTGEDFPKVVLEDISDIETGSDFGKINAFSSVVYEINIYAKGSRTASERTIAREIKDHVTVVMRDILGMKRIYCEPTPNVDTNIYRYTMRYQVLRNDRRNKFI